MLLDNKLLCTLEISETFDLLSKGLSGAAPGAVLKPTALDVSFPLAEQQLFPWQQMPCRFCSSVSQIATVIIFIIILTDLSA